MEKRPRARLRVCALRWLWCALVFTAAGGEASGQPANDDCAQAMAGFAIPPGGGTVAGTLAGATRDATGTTCPGNQSGADVYHTITPTITGSYTFETCGLAAWDTVLSVHTGCPASVANQLPQACSDDLCGAQSRVGSVLLIAGRTYIVRVGAYASASVVGPYSLLATFVARAPNDECGAGNPLLMLDVPVATGNQGASTTITIDPASLCGGFPGSGGGADIFYRFKPPTSGGYTVSTCGSAIDTVVSVHSGCPVGESNLVGCNDDGPGGLCSSNALNSLVYVTLTAGREYFVRVAGYRYPDASGAPRVGSLVVLVRRDPNAIVLGACCGGATGGPACEIRAADECSGVGGVYAGDDTSCAAGACGATGACCLGDGTCVVDSLTECAGVHQGASTTCAGVECPQPTGVCCVGAVCMLTLPGDCSSPGGPVGAQWVGGSPCNSSILANAPCCRADFNKSGTVTVQDIFDFLNAWFAVSPFTHLAAPGIPTVQDIFDFLSVWFVSGC